jgi:DNA-binding NarL/FixJ family response regulator
MIPAPPTDTAEEGNGATPEPSASSGLLVVDTTTGVGTSSVAALLRAHVSSTVDAAPRIDVAGTLAEALDLLNVCEYAAILLELNLPDSSGLATLDRILAAHPVAAVIVLTGVAGDDLGGEAVTRGAADYLPREEMTVRMLQRSIRYAGERVH